MRSAHGLPPEGCRSVRLPVHMARRRGPLPDIRSSLQALTCTETAKTAPGVATSRGRFALSMPERTAGFARSSARRFCSMHLQQHCATAGRDRQQFVAPVTDDDTHRQRATCMPRRVTEQPDQNSGHVPGKKVSILRALRRFFPTAAVERPAPRRTDGKQAAQPSLVTGK